MTKKVRKSRQVKKIINEALEVAEYYKEVPVPRGLVSEALTMLLCMQSGMPTAYSVDDIKSVTKWLSEILSRDNENQKAST